MREPRALNGDSGGPVFDFPTALRDLINAKQFTVDELADRCQALGQPVGPDMIQKMLSHTDPWRLPLRRRTSYLAIESVARALDVALTDLIALFPDDAIQQSVFRQHLPAAMAARIRLAIGPPGLSAFIEALPPSGADLLAYPGVAGLRNGQAFAYIFALEREFSGLEMLVADEPPLILFDEHDVQRWVDGMGLAIADRSAFLDLFDAYQEHFTSMLSAGTKRYEVILHSDTFVRFLVRKDRASVRNLIARLSSALDLPNFALVLLDDSGSVDELEVICEAQDIPDTLDGTVSVVIRQTPIEAKRAEYTLVPMPQTFASLWRDIATIKALWALSLDQYSSKGLLEIAPGGRVDDDVAANIRGATQSALRDLRTRYG